MIFSIIIDGLIFAWFLALSGVTAQIGGEPSNALAVSFAGPFAGILAGLATGIAVGVFNGWLTTKIGIPSFLTTLAMMIGLINNGLILTGLEFSQQLIARGGIIILAVALSQKRA
jgi:ribose/xylose/arabinose/galactoside ABC-type transport system permease subunit